MPAAVPIIVGGAVATGTAAAVGTAIAGATISTAVATGIGAAAIGGTAALATGSKPKDALKTAVLSGLTAGVGSTIGAASAGAGVSDAAFVAADAAQLASQGLSQSAIADTLMSAGVNSSAAQTAASLALSGAGEAGIASQLGSQQLFTTPRYPGVGVEQTYTPAPGSFQEALPGMGVETQASQAPFTAAPDSFGAAVAPAATTAGYGLLSNVATPTSSLQEALRGARLASQLMGGSPQQQIGQQFPRGQQARPGGVDYSGLLGIMQPNVQMANVSPLLEPATLLPQYRPLSLLG